MSPIFIKFSFFHQMIALQKLWKGFLFHQKSSFPSWDNQIFLFPSFPLILPVGHYFRGWSKINLKDYDVINCLNKNSITHFVWYLQKEKRYDTETLSIDGVSNKEHFHGKMMQMPFGSGSLERENIFKKLNISRTKKAF